MPRLLLALVPLSIVALLAATQDAPKPRIPEFPLKALASAHAKQANFFVSREGVITRYSIHVTREALPDWMHTIADERLGKGKDVGYEIEQYPDGSEVYEIYRDVNGTEKAVSARRDRMVQYIGTPMALKDLPSTAHKGLASVADFKAEKAMIKEGQRFYEIHVTGTLNGAPGRVRLSNTGEILSVQRKVPAEVEVAQ